MTEIKRTEILAVIVSLIAGFLFYQYFQPEMFHQSEREQVDADRIQAAPWEYRGSGEGSISIQ